MTPPMRTPAQPLTDTELTNRFSYHAPKPGQQEKYEKVRAGCLELAKLIRDLTPVSREQSLALTALEEVMYHANGSIARNT